MKTSVLSLIFLMTTGRCSEFLPFPYSSYRLPLSQEESRLANLPQWYILQRQHLKNFDLLHILQSQCYPQLTHPYPPLDDPVILAEAGPWASVIPTPYYLLVDTLWRGSREDISLVFGKDALSVLRLFMSNEQAGCKYWRQAEEISEADFESEETATQPKSVSASQSQCYSQLSRPYPPSNDPDLLPQAGPLASTLPNSYYFLLKTLRRGSRKDISHVFGKDALHMLRFFMSNERTGCKYWSQTEKISGANIESEETATPPKVVLAEITQQPIDSEAKIFAKPLTLRGTASKELTSTNSKLKNTSTETSVSQKFEI